MLLNSLTIQSCIWGYLYYIADNILLCSLVHMVAGIKSSSIRQENDLISANVGDTVILRCFYEGDMVVISSWYKQTLGEKLQLFSTFYNNESDATFHHKFKDNPRFSVRSGKEVNHLRISDIELSDSATYYCGSTYNNIMEFGKGTIVIVKGKTSEFIKNICQFISGSVQPGDSVTLNCTIHTETCAGERSVYWFRHGSGEYHPGIIYTHGDRSDQCEKSPVAGSPTQSCVYNLPKRNLSLSDAGTYYCAVASCGEILFGNGTKLDIKGSTSYLEHMRKHAILHIVTMLLAQYLFSQTMAQDADSLHYVALNLSNKKNRSRRQRSNMEEETVYSGIRQ
uniref:Ig-like domain-containing protein n=1 Tax=Oncorhynchus mykiss TaxID=8022 RepID=A0A8C7LMT5_ONCMY